MAGKPRVNAHFRDQPAPPTKVGGVWITKYRQITLVYFCCMIKGMFQRIKTILRFRAAKNLYMKHERVLVPLMLVIGVVIDFVTFRSINTTTAFALLGVYALVAAVMILVMHRYDATKHLLERPSFIGYVRVAAPLVVQFTFGALLSAVFIFYWFSGSFIASWPFFAIVIGLMAGNEVLREHYLRPTVQLAVFSFILIMTMTTALPSLLGSIAPWVFVMATVVSLGLMMAYLQLLYRLRPDLALMKPSPMISTLAIFLVVNVAYFLNVIPPVPLSITQIGVYESVERRGGEYILESQEQTWLDHFLPGESIAVESGERVYVFASIFAPVDLDTTVIHHWQKFIDGKWVSVNRLSYAIVGGRKDGYRGYSYITNHSEGKWRVDVETLRGQVIGRIAFDIESR